MAVNKNNIPDIPQEKFAFANTNERISDKKFVDKPVGYFKDAWIRFKKNKASIVAACIIILIVLFAFLTPLFNTRYDATFIDSRYAKKAPRNIWLSQFGIAKGTVKRNQNENMLMNILSLGVAAEHDGDSTKTVHPLKDGLDSYYQPIKNIGEKTDMNKQNFYDLEVDTYLELGFEYDEIEQAEYWKIREWEEATGIQVLYPLIEKNEYNPDIKDANMWYKISKGKPVYMNQYGRPVRQEYSEDLVFEDNYMRDDDGNLVYYEYVGGGDFDTAQFKVRILYYTYYQYVNGFEPEYIFGTDSQGYDLALRMANGVRLSLLVAVFVSLINLILGAIYGSIEGYYGGTTDIIMERVSDILSGVPFIVVATLFQIHLAQKVGAIPSLLFAFVATGWIGTASSVRMQFYRFKNQEYVMAARTLGARDRRIIMKHIFPNSLGTLITSSVLVIPGVIFSESMLSFLGIVKLGGANTTSLGTLLSDSSAIWTDFPHLMLFPALVISLLMISFNLFGNGLRDAFNPSLRGVED